MGIALFELIKRQERNFLESLRTETTRKSYAWYFSRYEQFVSNKLADSNNSSTTELVNLKS